MKNHSLVLLVTLGACTTDDEWSLPDAGPPPVPWDLVKTKSMAAELPLLGMDSDRAGGLWLAYFRDTGETTPVDNLRLVHIGADGTKVAEHRFGAEQPTIAGIAFSGDALWLNISLDFGFENYLEEVDPATGVSRRRIPIERGIYDLAIDAGRNEVLMSSHFNRVIALDLATGAETWRVQVAPIEPGFAGLQRAIAVTDAGHLWIGATGVDRFEELDASHQHISTMTTDVTVYHFTSGFGVHLAWDGQIIAAAENQISWLVPRGELP